LPVVGTHAKIFGIAITQVLAEFWQSSGKKVAEPK
jgi:hypothetical protein